MNTKIGMLAIALVFLQSGMLYSQDISGSWQGVSYQDSGGPSSYYPSSMQISQAGTRVTGRSTSKLPNGSPVFITLGLTGNITNYVFRYSLSGVIAELPPPAPYYWCRNGTAELTYDSVQQTLKGPSNSPGCSGPGSVELWRLKVMSDTVFCQDKPIRLVVTGKNIKWYSNSALTNRIDTGNVINPKIIATTTLYVTQTHYNTESPAIPITVVIKGRQFSNINQVICEGLSFMGHSVSGKYVDTLMSASGCDSVRTLNLTVKSRSVSTINQTICEGQSFMGHFVAGKYLDTLVSMSGCDSIRTLYLTVIPRTVITINQTICEGQIFLGHNTSDQYIDTLKTFNNCDSVRILNLIVGARSFLTINRSICEGHDYMGHVKSGTYHDTLKTIAGCDSIVTLNLTVQPRSSAVITQTICEGQSFFGYTRSGRYVDTLSSINSCDSIRVLDLTVLKYPQPDLGPDRGLCDGESITLSPGQYSSYKWQDGSINNVLKITTPGLYSVIVTNSCGSQKDQVLVSSKNCTVMFPNAFTPNGDGKNDVFTILNRNNIQKFYMAIFNRWGQKVFETHDYTNGWNGKVNNKEQEQGLYVFYSEYKIGEILYRKKNAFMLIR